MKDQNPSSSKNKSPSSRSPSPPPPPSRETTPPRRNPEEQILKTPWEVLAELSSMSPPRNEHGNVGSGEGGFRGGAVAAALAVAGGSGGGTIVIQEGAVEGVKKRKSPTIKDPPNKEPKCEVCGRLFASWKAAFGHKRKHPERDYRGFYKPPKERGGSSAAAVENPPPQGNLLDLDLNVQVPEAFEYYDTEVPLATDEVPAAAAPEEVPPATEEHAGEEGKKTGVIDLNVTPSTSADE